MKKKQTPPLKASATSASASTAPLPNLPEGSSIPKVLSVLPLRDVVVYPHMIFPVLIGRENSIHAVSEALKRDKYIFLAAQSTDAIDPTKDDVFHAGTIAKIVQLVRLPNNLIKILVDGVIQARAVRFVPSEVCLEAEIEPVVVVTDDSNPEQQAMVRHAGELFLEYVRASRSMPPEIATAFANIQDPMRQLYYASANVEAEVEAKQKILERTSLREQYFELIAMLTAEIEVQKLEQDIDVKVQESIQKTQKRFFIQEQIRALQEELEDDDAFPELSKLREQLDAANLPEAALQHANEEFDKLKKTQPMSPEYGVLRNYLELVAALPWHTTTPDNLDILHVRQILDEDHFGLEQIKERILEYIAVLNLVRGVQGQVLCLSGPPGVGKTSLARSIARALGRKFVRMSLGGVRDEAEIRGHRRTYIGSMPGRIIQSMKRAGTMNPVILLDEVDKMVTDFRGDPSAALLEVLDPEQHHAFNDHYLEMDYDLSKVLFIATANVKFDIPAPLLDRMEIIELSSYVEYEKEQIARKHLIPRQLEKHGLNGFAVRFDDEAVQEIIRGYTKEAGVRNLERQIASVIRKVAKTIVVEIAHEAHNQALSKEKSVAEKPKRRKKVETEVPSDQQPSPQAPSDQDHPQLFASEAIRLKERIITRALVAEFLKVPINRKKEKEVSDKIGVVTGLAWTSMGGDILPVEVTIMPGKDKLTLTGKLGDVMKESAMAALSFVRANTASLGVPAESLTDKEIHIHVPEGAIPKDGPSAGITMTMALISAASGRAARGDVAMTGEVTLRGNILPIGGLNEKLLAAKQAGIKTVLIPKQNDADVAELNKQTTEGLEIVPVAHISEALGQVFRG
ncbi:MAG: endopeptidase La [Candidatus Kapabacteria bacterium]|jgi:ATP-dependent Lon protease|nr:endopeptidase La [Candidatus Kapabacteria bacterium]